MKTETCLRINTRFSRELFKNVTKVVSTENEVTNIASEKNYEIYFRNIQISVISAGDVSVCDAAKVFGDCMWPYLQLPRS